MAQYRVKNTSHLDKAFKVYGGHHIVPAGKEDDIPNAAELTEAQIEAFARDGVKVTVEGTKNKDDDVVVGPEAKHRGAGSYSIMEGETEIREKLTKEQAEAFNKLDAEGKAKWLTDNPAG
jgi:hypothetical protein